MRFALLAMCLVVFSCDLKPAPKARESPPAPAKTADPSESAARPAPASDVPGLAAAVCRGLGERARRAVDREYRSPLVSRAP